MPVQIIVDYSPANEANRRLMQKLGPAVYHQMHAGELAKTVRMTKAFLVKHIQSGLRAGEMRTRINTKRQRRRGFAKLWVTKGGARILASRYKGTKFKDFVKVRGRHGVKYVVPQGFYARGKYTKRWLVRRDPANKKKLISQLSPIDFGEQFSKVAPRAVRHALPKHVQRVFARMKRQGYIL